MLSQKQPTAEERLSVSADTEALTDSVDQLTGELRILQKVLEEIREDLGADSLGYLSIEGLRGTAAKDLKRGICDACFSDEYPVPIEPQEGVPQLTLFRTASDEDPAS